MDKIFRIRALKFSWHDCDFTQKNWIHLFRKVTLMIQLNSANWAEVQIVIWRIVDPADPAGIFLTTLGETNIFLKAPKFFSLAF